MSRVGELIQELCPDGVEYESLGKCCFLEKGDTPIQKAIEGKYPLVVTTEERKTSDNFQFDKPTVCIPLISSRGHGIASLNRVYYQEGEFALGSILCGVTPKDENQLSAKFLYLYLNHRKDTLLVPLMRGGANVSMSIDSLKRVKIPLPPIQLQWEIVRILDNFTELTAELTAELTERKQQYEYYLDEIFKFENKDIRYLPVKDVILSLKTGLNPRKNFILNEEGSTYPYVTGKNIYNNKINLSDNIDKITGNALELINRRAQLSKGLLLFASTGTGTVGRMAVIKEYNNDWGISETLYAIKVKPNLIMPTFLMYALSARQSKNQYEPKISKGSVPHLKIEDLIKVKIPVPSLSIQKNLVILLDNFDTICNDISSGLPAEIEARQKQYEYYRDKLLTFKEKTV